MLSILLVILVSFVGRTAAPATLAETTHAPIVRDVPLGYPEVPHDAPDGTYCNAAGCLTIGGTTHDGDVCVPYCVVPPSGPEVAPGPRRD